MSIDDFVFSTLIASHQDPATASRALALAEAGALHDAATSVRLDRDAAASAEGRDYWRGMTRAIEVLRLLADRNAADEQKREKSSSAEADATPAGPTGRVGQLLDAIRTAGGQWPVHRAVVFYRDNVPALKSMPHRHLRTVARGDLRDLTAWGHLKRHDSDGARRFYTLKTRKDGAQ